jgi:cytochrome c-type biogenesis protein CcmH/NrfF
MWRRSALSLVALVATATAAAAQAPPADRGDSLGRLAAPEAAGPAVAPVTPLDNSALVKSIESKIRCTCGCNLSVYTCRTTDFSCTTSPAMHRVVLARLAAGMTEAQVLAAFQKQYGDMIFMAPPRHGFNLMAYIMPFVGLGVGLGLVVGVVRRWGRAARGVADGAEAPVSVAADAGASPEELERLKHELDRFEA